MHELTVSLAAGNDPFVIAAMLLLTLRWLTLRRRGRPSAVRR